MTEKQVIKRVRSQIASAIEHDIAQGESVMKECFEDMHGETEEETDRNFKWCYAEMRRIARAIRSGA